MKILSPEREEIGEASAHAVRRMERQGWRIRVLSDSRVMVVGHRSAHVRSAAFGGSEREG